MTNVIAFPEKLCRVLVIDADPSTSDSVREALQTVSPRVRVHSAPDLATAEQRLSHDAWDLVVLKPWQAQPGKPLPISVIRKAGYAGPVVPVTAGGPPLKRIQKAARRADAPTPQQVVARQNTRAKTERYARSSVAAMISQLLDEPVTGA